MDSRVDEHMQLVEDCIARSSRLTAWEENFIQSIKERLEDERPLTPHQIEILERVWEKVTER